MKHFFYIVVFALSLCSVPLCAETSLTDYNRSASAIQPFSGNYSYVASSPVDIQLPDFSLAADSGSLIHPLDIVITKLPYKGGTAMQSNMENVSRMGDGMRLLPNGQHFSDSVPALISLAYEPNRIPMGYKPKDI